MATVSTLRFELLVKAVLDKTDGYVSALVAAQFKQFLTLAAGTGGGQVDIIYHDRFALAASGVKNIDLDGSLDNVLGTIEDFAKIKFIGIANTSSELATVTDADIIITGDFMTTNFGASFAMGLNTPGVFAWFDGTGKAVVADTGDVITITNNDASDAAQVDVLIAGTSS